MKLAELWNQNHRRVRRECWLESGCYLRLPFRAEDGTRGVWAHLFSRKTQALCGLPTPQEFLVMAPEEDVGNDWCVWNGPLDPADSEEPKP